MATSTLSPSSAAHQVSDSKWMEALARLGLATRAFVYLVIGVLAVAVAGGASAQHPDQRGALHTVALHAGGKVLLVVLTVGLFGYALWRFSEAAVGASGDSGNGARVKSFVRGVVYTVLGVSAISVLSGGSGRSQAHQQQSMTARVMAHTGGRYLVGAIGLIIVGVGLAMVVEGLTKRFLDRLRVTDMRATAQSVVTKLGMVGTTARGIVFGLAGVLLVEAAVQQKAHKSRGLDGALMTLAHQPYGKVLLAVAAFGLIAFGCYGFAEARWHKT